MDKRFYGTGRLFVRADGKGRESWYGSWWGGEDTRAAQDQPEAHSPVRRSASPASRPRESCAERIDHDLVLASGEHKTLAEAGGLYVDHLEHVMDRKRSTIQDYRGYLSRRSRALLW